MEDKTPLNAAQLEAVVGGAGETTQKPNYQAAASLYYKLSKAAKAPHQKYDANTLQTISRLCSSSSATALPKIKSLISMLSVDSQSPALSIYNDYLA